MYAPAGAPITLTYSSAPTWVWAAVPAGSGGAGDLVLVAAAAPPAGQAGTTPQAMFIAGTAIMLDPAGALYTAIGLDHRRVRRRARHRGLSGNVERVMSAGHGGSDEGGLPSVEDLTGPERDPAKTVAEVRHQLGIGVPRRSYGQPVPEEIGLD